MPSDEAEDSGLHLVRPVEPTFDLIVVGSGFAGTFLALRAVENQLSTAIVEAGGDRPRRGSLTASFGYEAVGEVDYPVNASRMIAVGGTSNHWGGVISRPFPNDFRMRSEYGLLSDWPISYGDVEAYLCQAEERLAVSGAPVIPGEPPRGCAYPQEFNTEAPDIPIQQRRPHWVPVPRSRETSREPVRLRREAIPRLEASPYGTLVQQEQVVRLVTLDGRRIDHIETYRADGTRRRYGARTFVVAAGAIETPRLLLLSRSPYHPTGLGNAEGLVGRYFSVHPSIETSFAADALERQAPGEFRAFEPIETMRREGLGGFHLHLLIARNGQLTWRFQPEMEARPENRISLSTVVRDRSGSPLPAVDLAFSDQDERTFERVRELIGDTKSSLAARVNTIEDWTRWRAHPSGTCRMGFDAETGVVDKHNRVFGIENLYLSGAATFTTAGTTNPTNLIVALTLRLADHILQSHRDSRD